MTFQDYFHGETAAAREELEAAALPYQEEARRIYWKQVALIHNWSRNHPEPLTRQQAEVQLLAIGRDLGPEWIRTNYNKLDKHTLFWLAVDVYIMAPYGSMKKSGIIKLRQIRPADYLRGLDRKLKDVDPVTVYRGAVESIPQAKNALSWTTDPIIAIFFYSARKDSGARLFKGTIEKSKIIATDDDRKEAEVIQHSSVKNIEVVKITEKEEAEAMKTYKELASRYNI